MPRLFIGDGPKILPIDIAGTKSVIEALRSGIAEAEDVLVESVQKARTLSAVRNEALTDLQDKYGMRGNNA
jgi:hypothetical protein